MFKDLVYAISGQFPDRDDFCQFTLSNELEVTVSQREPDDIDLHCFLLEVNPAGSNAVLIAIAAANFGLIASKGCTLGYLASSQQVVLSYRLRHVSRLTFEMAKSDAIGFLATAIDWRHRLRKIVGEPEHVVQKYGSIGFEQVATQLV
jgi:hypothetical protein